MRARLRRAYVASSYLLVGAATALLGWALIGGLTLVLGLTVVLVGVPLLPEAALALRRFAGLERRRAGRMLGAPVPERYPPLTGPLPRRLRRTVSDPATYRDAAWLLVHGFAGLVGGAVLLAYWLSVPLLLSVPLWWWLVPENAGRIDITLTPQPFPPSADGGLVVYNTRIDSWPRALTIPPLTAAAYAAALVLVTPWLAGGYARLARWLLSPSARTMLAERVEALTETRAGALDAHAAELRRIERDLHDGAQARLVAIAMRLGLAERGLTGDPRRVTRLLREAREDTEQTMAELRQVVRTIYPPILSDRGLDGAVSSLVAACPIRVATELEPLGRLPAAVEAAAYFVIAESLANVARHSRAGAAQVRLGRRGDTLHLSVRDDGRGGADERGGTGLAGIRRRASALDGTYRLSSPPGGPTELTVELPCGS